MVEYLNNPDYFDHHHEDGDFYYTKSSDVLQAVTYGLCREILEIPDIYVAQNICEDRMPQKGIDQPYIELILDSLEKLEIIQNVSPQVYGNDWRKQPKCNWAYTRQQAWDEFPEEMRPKFNSTTLI